jgi:hypothetical protein
MMSAASSGYVLRRRQGERLFKKNISQISNALIRHCFPSIYEARRSIGPVHEAPARTAAPVTNLSNVLGF